ncbi:hypothetical protein DN402_02720 [Streptomyces sp. SW4]|nr:hypothetical protein DN402_02720 [Streptomyces sp. SW4]
MDAGAHLLHSAATHVSVLLLMSRVQEEEMETSTPEGKVQPLGRRERNKIKIKERLYAAALELFAERGYEQTSVDEIAERADVARGTFFNHFQRKEDLISTWGERRRERLVAVMADALPSGSAPPTACAAVSRSWAVSTRKNTSGPPRCSPPG